MEALLTSIIVGLITFSILVLLNALLAYAVKLYSNEFEWSKMLEFLKRRVAVYVMVWLGFSLVNILIFWLVGKMGYEINLGALGSMVGIINFISALIVALLVAKIIGKLKKIGIAVGNN